MSNVSQNIMKWPLQDELTSAFNVVLIFAFALITVEPDIWSMLIEGSSILENIKRTRD